MEIQLIRKPLAITEKPKMPLSRQTAFLLFLAVLPFATVACPHVQLISRYDPVFDEMVSDFQLTIEKFLVKMERKAGRPVGAYETNQGFYEDAQAEINVIEFRANAHDKNTETIEQIKLLRESINDLEAFHREGGDKGLIPPILKSARDAIQRQLNSILLLEQAKKRKTESAKR